MKAPILITQAEIQQIYKPINPKTHKGIQGHAAIIAGSYGKIGAAVLASKACIKSGCGLVTTHIPKCGYEILQSTIPEVMVVTATHEKYISEIIFDIKPQAIGIGPGIGQEPNTQKAFQEFLKTNKTPLVIDADALNILSQNKSWYDLLQPDTILTPHPKELERLIGSWRSEIEKLVRATEFSKQHQVIIVMKGAPTQIVNGESVYENTTGNAALATAGSGDVLTGIITSLLAQGYLPIKAAQLGVYIHGLTADIALPETGYQSFIASDIIANLGKAFLALD
ncbi:NAD(P)H-hydrate dehydratase [Flavobacterium hydatis]|uniref:ADP-dependent (S)-NAD(P)H-hydrate dehydratase n=1 Tax=Flavobacterium hydatis TaxID=991 RepID=A0A086AJ92_FLAHY|nr:NAD(P)H-hydrate dehydratase [Flavobacterium hydatis]KFF16756.1 ADP-dependent (S)-NAD(P)H-hydrate dehydratase [Flavobacterium hydatis]OXA95327.1 NAD(P)H-hydrate dehydratase [Flavobacterium hydatis]